MKDKVSFLLSCYANDDPDALREALSSVNEADEWFDIEVVIVIDGPVGNIIHEVIDEYRISSMNNIVVSQLPKNGGLGIALKYGVKYCSGDFIFRLDSDDISVLLRVPTQVEFLKSQPEIYAVGGFIEEFNYVPGDLSRKRKVPLSPQDIAIFSKMRNPINHVSACFRKEFFDHITYEDMPLYEDYFLWINALRQNIKLANIEETFVHVRVVEGIGDRRSGVSYFKKDLAFALAAYKIKHFGVFGMSKFLYVRVFVRLLPKSIVSRFYNLFLRS